MKRDSALATAYWSAVGAVSAIGASVLPVFAAGTTIWDKLTSMLTDIYGRILGISTIVAVVVAAVALVIRMVSRNQRAVDEATAWLKRIVITWIILNSLGFIVTYIRPLVDGGTYVQNI
jgi:hypothetical protein